MVADSALYSDNNLNLMSNLKWISRVPLSIKKAKKLVKAVFSLELKETDQKGYSSSRRNRDLWRGRAKMATSRK